MITIENSKIRVTLSEGEFEKYKCPDRIEKLPSGDTRTHSGENETRGRILSHAMRALAHRQAVRRPLTLDMDAGRAAVLEEYVYEYLREHTRYNINDLIARITMGHRLSRGQAEEYASARAYADGKMGNISRERLLEIGREMLGTEADSRRGWEKFKLMSDSNADANIEQRIARAAMDIAARERDHSRHFTLESLQIEIIDISLMPTQIGLQTYNRDEQHD